MAFSLFLYGKQLANECVSRDPKGINSKSRMAAKNISGQIPQATIERGDMLFENYTRKFDKTNRRSREHQQGNRPYYFQINGRYHF